MVAGFRALDVKVFEFKVAEMLSREGRHYMEQAPWPGLCLTIVVYSLNMFGDAARNLLAPRLRVAAGRLDAPRAQPVKFGA